MRFMVLATLLEPLIKATSLSTKRSVTSNPAQTSCRLLYVDEGSYLDLEID